MARVTGPFLSLGARGTLAGALTASNWKGISTMRIKGNPSNPKTLNQMKVRAYFAAGGKITKASDVRGDLAAFVRGITPAQQSWASFYVREMLGTGNVNIEAAKTAYNTVGNATVKGYFDGAASQAGVQAVDLDGTTNTQVSGGLSLWAAYTAAYRLHSPDAPAVVTSVTETQVFAFTEALTGILPSQSLVNLSK